MKKLLLLLLILPYLAIAQSADATPIENILLTNVAKNNNATRVIVQDSVTKELKFVLKSSLQTNISIGNKNANTFQLLSSTGTGAILPAVSTTEAGLMPATDKVKLNGITTGATANSTDTQLRDRTTHTGVQAIATVTGLQSALDSKQNNLGFTPYNATNPSGFTANSTDTQLRNRTTHTGVQAIATVTGLQTALDVKQSNLGFTPENVANKQNSLAVDGTGEKYTTVDAVNEGLDLKSNINNPIFTGSVEVPRLAIGIPVSFIEPGDVFIANGGGFFNGNGKFNGNIIASSATQNNHLTTLLQVNNLLGAKLNSSEKGQINGVATLNSIGKIPNDQIPALAISETFPIASQAEMLALSLADQGDVAIRSDLSKAFILRQSPSSVLANWSELLTPASTVTSVAGKVGAVLLNSGDVGLGNVPNINFTSAVSANTAKITNATHTGDVTGSTALTLATVNSNIGTFNNVAVNNKGLVTSASNVTYATGGGTATGANTGDNATNSQYSGLVSNATHTGDVTGSTALTLVTNIVTNAKLAQVPTKTFKGRTSAATGNVEDLTVAQVKTDLTINLVDNTSDLNKPISTATQTTLDGKQNNLGFTPYNATNPSGFTANSTDAQLRDRTTHTGTQLSSTISDIQSTITNNTAVLSNTAKVSYSDAAKVSNITVTQAVNLDTMESNITTNNAKVGITTTQSSNIVTNNAKISFDNTSSTRLANTSGTNTGDNATNTQYSGLVSNATHTGDATGSTALILATVNANIGTFNNVTVNGKGLVTSASNVTYATGGGTATGANTGDQDLSDKANIASPTFTGTVSGITKSMVGLSNVPNLSFSGTNTGDQNLLNYVALNGFQIITGNKIMTGANAFNGTLGATNPSSVVANSVKVDNGSGFSSVDISGSRTSGNLGGLRARASSDTNSFFEILPQGDKLATYFSTGNGVDGVSPKIALLQNGFVGIGTTNPTEKLDVVGNGKFSGTVTAASFFQSSDIRLKNIIKRDGDVIYYTWKDKRDTKSHIGYIAQKVIAKNPDQVNKDDEGYLSVNYIEILVEKIRNLEKEIIILKAK
jgi:hypothetical protein